MGKAIGMIETVGIATTIEATDVMLKAADVVVYRQNKTDPALVTTYIVGDVRAVDLAIDAGRKVAERFGTLVACSVIPSLDGQTDERLMK